jgi:formamidase
MADLHFSKGGGEITFCGAIEMAGWLHIKVDVIKNGVAKYRIRKPVFKPSPMIPLALTCPGRHRRVPRHPRFNAL